ncbi:hypothetical protein OC844_007355, partial [Tilletia horrida]
LEDDFASEPDEPADTPGAGGNEAPTGPRRALEAELAPINAPATADQVASVAVALEDCSKGGHTLVYLFESRYDDVSIKDLGIGALHGRDKERVEALRKANDMLAAEHRLCFYIGQASAVKQYEAQ